MTRVLKPHTQLKSYLGLKARLQEIREKEIEHHKLSLQEIDRQMGFLDEYIALHEKQSEG